MLDLQIAPPAPRHHLAVELGSFALILLLPLLLLAPRLQDHPRSTLTIVNPAKVDLDVALRSDPTAGATPIGRVPADGDVTIDEIWDVGDVWVLELRGQGESLGSITVQRSELEANGWTVELPASVVRHIDALDVPPSPG